MRQVFYIEADEEMISVIGRLRKSSADENVIVAPHRSLILQSIVNLRLLNHDAQKNGKEIIVVTQDDQSRSLCEKAGIRTQAVLDEQDAHANSAQYEGAPPVAPSRPSDAYPFEQSEAPRQDQGIDQEADASTPAAPSLQLPHSDSIGSTDFFGDASIEQPQLYADFPSSQQQPAFKEPAKAVYGDIKKLAVRDKNPKKLTTLNSTRFEDEKLMNQQKSFTPPSLRGAQPVRPLFTPPPPAPISLADSPAMRVVASHPDSKHPLWFLAQEKRESDTPSTPPAPRKSPERQSVNGSNTIVSDGGKMKAFFMFFGFISVLSVASVGAYLFLPKADVDVKLKVSTQKSDFEFEGSSQTKAYSADSKIIPVRVVEKDQDVSLSFDATGKASLADQKARGSVVIYNEFSADPQLLVASTRLLSQDGKVFRLLSGVKIPGMTTVNGKTEPGSVEAAVAADQSGPDYNIAATSFTIPGFQSSAKQNKIYAKSSTAMNGGGSNGSDVSAVSDADVAAAKKTVEAKVKDVAVGIANQDLNPGEKALDEATDVAIVSSNASPQSGAVTDSFEYHVKVHVRAIVFSEDDLKKMINTLFAQQNAAKGLGSAIINTIDLQYGEPTADFAAGTLRIKVHAVGHSESGLDEAQLKSDLLGKDQDAITDLLRKYTQVDTISVSLWPEFIATKIPTREDRVTINIQSLDTEVKK